MIVPVGAGLIVPAALELHGERVRCANGNSFFDHGSPALEFVLFDQLDSVDRYLRGGDPGPVAVAVLNAQDCLTFVLAALERFGVDSRLPLQPVEMPGAEQDLVYGCGRERGAQKEEYDEENTGQRFLVPAGLQAGQRSMIKKLEHRHPSILRKDKLFLERPLRILVPKKIRRCVFREPGCGQTP